MEVRMNYLKTSFQAAVVLLGVSVLCINVLWAQQQKNAGADKNLTPEYSIFAGTLVDMTWPEVKKAAGENAVVILPVAVIEQHGPHMNLGTDTYLGYKRSVQLRQQLESAGIKAVVAPPFYWGIMQLNESGAFPGSFTVNPSTMKALLGDIFADLHRWGFHYVYCFNHHGDRLLMKTLNEAIAEAKEKLGIVFYNDQEQKDRKGAPDFEKYVTEKLFEPNYHAGTFETSMMLDHYPEFVNLEIAKTLKPEGTWQPLGYVGDPANFKSVKMLEYNKADVNYIASCVANWYKAEKEKKE